MGSERPHLGPRTFSAAVKHAAHISRVKKPFARYSRDHDLERRRLLGEDSSSSTDSEEDSQADSDGLFPPRAGWTDEDPHPPNPHRGLPVYRTIFMIRRDVICSIGKLDNIYSQISRRSSQR